MYPLGFERRDLDLKKNLDNKHEKVSYFQKYKKLYTKNLKIYVESKNAISFNGRNLKILTHELISLSKKGQLQWGYLQLGPFTPGYLSGEKGKISLVGKNAFFMMK